MPVIGSSSIIPSATIGPQGPTGVTGHGFTGGTGATGPTGATGATGTYVESSYFIEDDPNLYLILSDGSEIKIEGLKGNTGAGATADGKNSGSGVGIFKLIDGNTFWFKGISGSGSVLVYETDFAVGISGDKEYQRGSTADISERLRFAYLSDGATADVTGLTFDPGLTGTMIFGLGATGNKWSYDPEEIIISVPEIESTETVTIYGGVCEGDCGHTAGKGVGIQLGVSAGTIFDVQTPIGIAGFTGDFQDEIINFTILLRGNALWDWPANLYFDKQDRFFSCGTDIINILSEDGGASWYGTVSVRGFGVEECESVYGVGSCCYIDNGGNHNCRDYITEEACNNLYNSFAWNPLSTCADNCGLTGGVCCTPGGNWGLFPTEGVCNENFGPAECKYFYGTYLDEYHYREISSTDRRMERIPGGPVKIECGGILPCHEWSPGDPNCIEGQGHLFGEPLLSNDLCVGSCNTQDILCCKNGRCIGDNSGSTFLGILSPVACRYVYGGTPIQGGLCGDIDCCDYIDHSGACCRQTGLIDEGTCTVELYSECISSGGVFMGPETYCLGENGGVNEVNCCFGPGGACCKNGECSYPTYQSVCENLGGIWYGEATSCSEVENELGCYPTGACCDGDSCTVISQSDCYVLGGTYLGDNISCEDNPCDIPEQYWGCCCDVTGQCGGSFTGTERDCNECNGNWHINTQCDIDACGNSCPEEEICCEGGELWLCGGQDGADPYPQPYDPECKPTYTGELNPYGFDECTVGSCCSMCSPGDVDCTAWEMTQAECYATAIGEGWTIVEAGEGTGNYIAYSPDNQCERKWVAYSGCNNPMQCCHVWGWSPSQYCHRCVSNWPWCCEANYDVIGLCGPTDDLCTCAGEVGDEGVCPDIGGDGGFADNDGGDWQPPDGGGDGNPWDDFDFWECGKCCYEDSSVDENEECGKIKCVQSGGQQQCENQYNGFWQQGAELEGNCCNNQGEDLGECEENCETSGCCPDVYSYSCGACCVPVESGPDPPDCFLLSKYECDNLDNSIFHKGKRCSDNPCDSGDPTCDPPCEKGQCCCSDGDGGYGCTACPCIDPNGECPPGSGQTCQAGECCCRSSDGGVGCEECPCDYGDGGGGGDDDDCPTCPKEVCEISWTACKGLGEIERSCSRCVLLPKGTCQQINGMRVNPKCNVGPGDDPCLNGGTYQTTLKTPECCSYDCEDYDIGTPTCSSALADCFASCTGCLQTNYACGQYGPGGSTNPNLWRWFDSGCCEGPGALDCGRCNISSASCLDCDGCEDNDSVPGSPGSCGEECLIINSLNSLGEKCGNFNDSQPCQSGNCDGCSAPECYGFSSGGQYPDCIRDNSRCCWRCDCTEQQLNSQGGCCRCGGPTWDSGIGDYVCNAQCTDGLPNQGPVKTKYSDCYCGECKCKGGHCGEFDGIWSTCGCPQPLVGGGDHSLVELPNGNCIWMMCEPPDCPYPLCDD